MKIGFDAKRVTHNATGLGNYSRFIINILANNFPDNEYYLYTPDKGQEKLRGQITKSPQIVYRFATGMLSHISKSLWRSFSIVSSLKKDRIDIFHGLSNELPFYIKKDHIKSIVTIHDLIFLRYPQFYKNIDRIIYKYKFRKACQNADCIIAISEMTKQDIVKYFGINSDKIQVIYQGCDYSFTKTIENEVKKTIKEKYNLPDNYILNVGSIESRKNLLLIVKSLQYLDKNISLVAIGKRTSYTEEIENYIKDHNLSNRIQIFNNIPFNDLPAIYQMASVFVYPSFFEGFGIPIIEALHSNIPVIAAKGSCLEEAGGKESIYIDPTNEHELAQKISYILSSPQQTEKMKLAGKEYVKRFSGSVIAGELMGIYKKLSS